METNAAVDQSWEELDRLVVGRAKQYDFQLVQDETDTGQLVFEWRFGDQRLGPQFVRRRLAIDWMSGWLDAETPAGGFALPTDAGESGLRGLGLDEDA